MHLVCDLLHLLFVPPATACSCSRVRLSAEGASAGHKESVPEQTSVLCEQSTKGTHLHQ